MGEAQSTLTSVFTPVVFPSAGWPKILIYYSYVNDRLLAGLLKRASTEADKASLYPVFHLSRLSDNVYMQSPFSHVYRAILGLLYVMSY